jgi:hypothetical protein
MKLLRSLTLLSICVLTLSINALPLAQQHSEHSEHQLVRRKGPYSVVPVDGGQPAGTEQPKTQIVTKDSTQTVTEPPKTLPPVTETTLSTTVVTVSETPTTIITTSTTISTPVATPIPAPEHSPSISTTVTTLTSMISTADTATITSSPTLTPYDDGMWHTTYYKAAETSSSLEATSSAAADEAASPTSDVDSASFTGIPSNGTYALMLRGKNKPKPFHTTMKGTIFTSSIAAAVKSNPPMPTLPKTSEVVNPTEIPSIDVAKHVVPGFGR